MTFPFPSLPGYRVAGAPAAGAHRFWGVRITSAQDGGSTYAISRIEMSTTSFGENLLPTASGIAGATNSFSGYTPASALSNSLTDSGSSGDAWATTAGGTQRWHYDFGAGNEVEIKRVSIFGRGPSFFGQNPKDFDIVWSDDGSTWTVAQAVTSAPLNYEFAFSHFFIGSLPTYTGSPWGAHLRWTLNTVRDNGSLAVAVGELELRDTPSGTNLATSGTPTASSSYSGAYTADKAFDGTTSTLWSAAASSVSAQLHYEKSVAYAPAELAIKSRADGFPTSCPMTFALQYSDDGGTHVTTVLRPADQSSWGASETRSFVVPNYI